MSERSRRDVKSKAEKYAEYKRVREGGGRTIKVRGVARMGYSSLTCVAGARCRHLRRSFRRSVQEYCQGTLAERRFHS